MKELTTQGEYQLRLRDLATDEKVKALTEAAAAQAAASKARYEALEMARNLLRSDSGPACTFVSRILL